MGIFNKKETDIKTALRQAREDERSMALVEFNKDKALEIEALNNKWSLKVKEKEAKIDSMSLRMLALEEKEKQVERDRQSQRETSLLLRHILEDMKYFSDKSREIDIEKGQSIDRLIKEIKTVESVLITE